MEIYSNLKKRGFKNYDYRPYKDNQIKYNKYDKYSSKHYKIEKYQKNNQLIEINSNNLKNDKDKEIQYAIQLINIEDTTSFYPKNYIKDESPPVDNTNNDSHLIYISLNNNKDFSISENSKFYNNNKKNENESQSFKHNIGKLKKFGIKSIPLPKVKKGKEAYFISRKKIQFYQNNIEEEENNFIKDRKLLNNNNFDSAKHSISTLNSSSSSSCKEKVRKNDEKKAYVNENQIWEFNFDNNYQNNKIIKNKFENNSEIGIKQNIYNTEILNVNIKISKNKNVVFKLRRFDDIFFTAKLFCEINSIDEKFIKPIIIKTLLALNTIYQVMNCQISSECISLLKKIKNINKFE